MATEIEEKEQAEEKPAESAEPAKPEPDPEKGPPRKREILLPVLTLLFALVGIADLVLWALTGFGLFRGVQAQRAYEARQASLQTETSQPVGASYRGPGLVVENGEVVWRRTDELTQDGGILGSGVNSGAGIGTDGSTQTSTIPRGLWIPYPPPLWAREDTSNQTAGSNAAQTPVQT